MTATSPRKQYVIAPPSRDRIEEIKMEQGRHHEQQ